MMFRFSILGNPMRLQTERFSNELSTDRHDLLSVIAMFKYIINLNGNIIFVHDLAIKPIRHENSTEKENIMLTPSINFNSVNFIIRGTVGETVLSEKVILGMRLFAFYSFLNHLRVSSINDKVFLMLVKQPVQENNQTAVFSGFPLFLSTTELTKFSYYAKGWEILVTFTTSSITVFTKISC